MPLSICILADELHESEAVADAVMLMVLDVLLPEHKTWEYLAWMGIDAFGFMALLGSHGLSRVDFPLLKCISLGFDPKTRTEGDGSAFLSIFRYAPHLDDISLNFISQFDKKTLPELPYEQLRILELNSFYENDLQTVLELIRSTVEIIDLRNPRSEHAQAATGHQLDMGSAHSPSPTKFVPWQ